jgi:ribosomal protein S27AE
VRPAGTVVVRCLRCRHQSNLSDEVLARYWLKGDAPISTFVKRLRCHRCGSGSVMATRQAGLPQRSKSGTQRRRASAVAQRSQP